MAPGAQATQDFAGQLGVWVYFRATGGPYKGLNVLSKCGLLERSPVTNTTWKKSPFIRVTQRTD